MEPIYKYPKTYHLQGSKVIDRSPDKNLTGILFKAIANSHLVIEEKVDGANVAISFASNGQILLQSRGNYLTGETRENWQKMLIYLKTLSKNTQKYY